MRLSDPRVVLSDTFDLETKRSNSFSDVFGDRRMWCNVDKSRSVRILSTLSNRAFPGREKYALFS